MRILTLAIFTIATASAAPSARAQTYDPAYPVCLQIYQGWNDYYFECAYTSLAQCNMSASGRAAQCIINPYYAGAKQRRRDDETGGIAASIELIQRMAGHLIGQRVRVSRRPSPLGDRRDPHIRGRAVRGEFTPAGAEQFVTRR